MTYNIQHTAYTLQHTKGKGREGGVGEADIILVVMVTWFVIGSSALGYGMGSLRGVVWEGGGRGGGGCGLWIRCDVMWRFVWWGVKMLGVEEGCILVDTEENGGVSE